MQRAQSMPCFGLKKRKRALAFALSLAFLIPLSPCPPLLHPSPHPWPASTAFLCLYYPVNSPHALNKLSYRSDSLCGSERRNVHPHIRPASFCALGIKLRAAYLQTFCSLSYFPSSQMQFVVALQSELDHMAGLCCKGGWENRWPVS